MKNSMRFGLSLVVSALFCTAAFAGSLDLTGTRLGETDFVKNPNPKDKSTANQSGLDQSAVRIYISPAGNDTYYAVLMQYADAFRIAGPYLLDRGKNDRLKEKVGYLNQVIDKLSVYKLTPGKEAGTYDMAPLTVVDGKIEVYAGKKMRLLTLAKDAESADPLAGAKISAGDESIKDIREITFPKKNSKGKWESGGRQFRTFAATSKFPAKLLKLKSTWHGDFIRNRFLAAYAKPSDQVAVFDIVDGEMIADFNDPLPSTPERLKVFSNAKSAGLKGLYTVTNPVPGMFVFATKGTGHVRPEEVTSRIALGIDIVDATVKLHQNVIEIGMVNPNDPSDFLMYYEDDNQFSKGRQVQVDPVPMPAKK